MHIQITHLYTLAVYELHIVPMCQELYSYVTHKHPCMLPCMPMHISPLTYMLAPISWMPVPTYVTDMCADVHLHIFIMHTQFIQYIESFQYGCIVIVIFGNIHNSPYYLHIGNVISTYPQPRQAADRSCCKSTARCCSSRASLPRRFRLGLWHHPMERCLKNASKTRVEVTLFGQAFAKHQPLAFIDVAFINQIKGCTWPQPSAGDSITPLKFPTTASHQAPTRKGKTLAPHSQRFGLFQCFNGGELWDNPKLYTLVSGGRGKSSGTLLRPDKPGLVMRVLEEKDSI